MLLPTEFRILQSYSIQLIHAEKIRGHGHDGQTESRKDMAESFLSAR